MLGIFYGYLNSVKLMRLQVFLSHSGACSRRKALELVKSGKVKVNGSIVIEPSYPIDSSKDSVCLNNKKVFLKEKVYILLNKPRGVTTTKKDYFAEKTVMDLLPSEYKHLNPVGRLDKDTTGLLMLTNDGDLAYKLSHPSFSIDRIYIVYLDKELNENHRKILEKGIDLDGELAFPCKIIPIGNKKIKVIIHQGRKRQIRRMFIELRYKVAGLERIGFGSLDLGSLALGSWRKVSYQELVNLKETIEKNEQ